MTAALVCKLNRVGDQTAAPGARLLPADLEIWEERRSPQEARTVRTREDRTAYDRDRARIIHSSAFRRLQAKTQVLGINEGDFHRTRLTHSMEVAQVARGILHHLGAEGYRDIIGPHQNWLPHRDLVEAICFAHDLGHPPFGHAGERALNNALLTAPPYGTNEVGFEGNGQTLRLLTHLEAHTEGYGLDLTRRTLLGVLKYPVKYSMARKRNLPRPQSLLEIKWSEWEPPKCYLDSEANWVEWILQPFPESDRVRFTAMEDRGPEKNSKPIYKSLDCSIMDVADEIAYGVHDFEDGIALDLIRRHHWEEEIKGVWDSDWARAVGLDASADEVGRKLFRGDPDRSASRKREIGGLVNALITSVTPKRSDEFEHPLLKLNAQLVGPGKALLDRLQRINLQRIIRTPSVQTLEYRGQINVLALFRAIESEPEIFLGGKWLDRLRDVAPGPNTLRVITDYIAGMTDEYATRFFERTFLPRHGTVFDRL